METFISWADQVDGTTTKPEWWEDEYGELPESFDSLRLDEGDIISLGVGLPDGDHVCEMEVAIDNVRYYLWWDKDIRDSVRITQHIQVIPLPRLSLNIDN